MRKSLVSILLPNYNYAHYLEQCLESVLNQTYDNIEVIISDNQSVDDSFQIIKEYEKKFTQHGIWYDMLRNKRNIGSAGNTAKCFERAEGEYFIWLSTDDYLEPDAIENMVKGLELYPHAGCVMVHRNEVDEYGNVIKKPSFYNQSCMIEGEAQAAVYMMAGIAVSSQILFRKSTYINMLNSKHLRFQVAGDWYDNFMMACFGDVVYIKKPLVNYRVHTGNETNESEIRMIGVMEHYQLINAFCTIADSFKMTKPQERYEEAVKKLGQMCLRYCRKMIQNYEFIIAKKYLNLALVYDENLDKNDQYQWLNQCLDSVNPYEVMEAECDVERFERNVSYDPPKESVRIPELE